jgi:hypothetical protein
MQAERIACVVGIIQQYEARLVATEEKKPQASNTTANDDKLLLLLKEMMQKPTFNIGSVQGNFTYGNINTTVIYEAAIKKIDEANAPEEQKFQAKKVLDYVKETAPAVLPIVIEGVKKWMGIA